MNIHVLVFSLWYLCYWCWRQQDISTVYTVFLWIIIRQNVLARYIIPLFDRNRPSWFQAVILEQVLLKKNLHFNMWEETSIFKLQHKPSFWHFCQSGTLPGKVNIDVFPNIWKRNTFWATSLYALRVNRQFQRKHFSDWVCSRVKLKLKSP